MLVVSRWIKSKEVKKKPCGIDDTSMEKDEGAEARR